MSRSTKSAAAKKAFQRKLAGYTAMAGAAMAVGGETDAAPVVKLNQNVMISPGQIFDLDIDNDGPTDFRFQLQQNSNSMTGGFNVGNTTTNVSSNGLMAVVNYANYSRFYRDASFSGNAYASKIGLSGQIALSGGIRKLSSGSVIDGPLFATSAGGQGNLGTLRSSYFVNQNNSSVRYLKRIYSNPGGPPVSSYTTNSRFGGYSTGPTSMFSSTGVFPGMRGFMGVQFNTTGGTTHFGWIDVELAGDYKKLTIHGWGYESEANTPIAAGQVPEPSTLATLAMGAAGVLALKRTRRRKPQATNDDPPA